MVVRTTLVVGLMLVVLSTVAQADLVLGAPPRETIKDGERIYKPLAEYLTRVSGEKVVYRHPVNWGIYQALMTKGEYDLVFDGPHFVSWRIEKSHHVPLAALAGELAFVVVVGRDNNRARKITDLAGAPVCAHSPPNLATLTLLDQFPNPSRQPRLVEAHGFEAAYRDMLNGKCEGTVLPTGVYQKLDGAGAHTRVLYSSKSLPNQALTAGPRVSEGVRNRIKQALLATGGQATSQPVAVTLGAERFIAVTADNYKGHAGLLRNVWGFEPAPIRIQR